MTVESLLKRPVTVDLGSNLRQGIHFTQASWCYSQVFIGPNSKL